jgi:hypothetical protein
MQFTSKQSNTFGFSPNWKKNAINITDTNFTELRRLWKEFDFSEIAAKLSKFRPSMDFKEAKAETEDADRR